MLLSGLHVHSWWKFRHYFFLHIMCALTTFIYSYIHTSCDVLWSTISHGQSRVSCVVTKRVIVCVKVHHLVCWKWSEPSYFCSVREKPTGQDSQPISTFMWSRVTQEQKCLASSGEKNMWWKFVISQNTWILDQCYAGKPRTQCIIFSILHQESIPLADVGKVFSGDLHRKKHLILSQQQRSERMKHWLLQNFLKLLYFNH